MKDKQKYNLCIRSLNIDWDKINRDLYLKEIPSLKDLDHLEFSCPVTFLWEKTVAGNRPCLRV